jgi:hypothetical protein
MKINNRLGTKLSRLAVEDASLERDTNNEKKISKINNLLCELSTVFPSKNTRSHVTYMYVYFPTFSSFRRRVGGGDIDSRARHV